MTDAVRTHLRQVLSLYPPDQLERSGLHYEGPMGFVLRHGVTFSSPPKLPTRFAPMRQRECFANAAALALTVTGLTYVEGYAQASFLPVPHAWVIDRGGVVCDVTWRDWHKGVPRDQWVYVGVPFTRRYLSESLRRNDSYGLIDQWERRFPMLRRPLPKRAVPRRYHPAVFR